MRSVRKKMCTSKWLRGSTKYPEDQVTKDQRFVGKTTILGAGYGMGALKFQAQLKSFGTEIELDEARRIINIYRDANWKISHVWREAQNMVSRMEKGDTYQFGKKGVIEVIGDRESIRLPSKLLMRYEDLKGEQNSQGVRNTVTRHAEAGHGSTVGR